MIREQTILLKIWYDDSHVEPPMMWDWPELLGEDVSLLEVDGEPVRDNHGNLVRE